MNALEIDFLPVGTGSRSGDAIALRMGNVDENVWKDQHVFIVDGGDSTSGESLVAHIKDVYKTDKVEGIFLTHPDADHASGLRNVIKQVKVGGLWMHRPWNHWVDVKNSINDGRITEKSFGLRMKVAYAFAEEVEELARENKIEMFAPHQGSGYLDDGKNKLINILGPGKDFYLDSIRASGKTPEMEVSESISKAFASTKKTVAEDMTFETENLAEKVGETSAENDMSLILYITVAGAKILLTGDSGTMALYKALHFAVSNNIDLSTLNLLQLPHHGSRHNLSKGILEKINANYAVVSCAPNGAPRHPSAIVTNSCLRRGMPVYQTSGNSISFRFGQAPQREGWVAAQPIPFSHLVEIPA